ncbi:fra a 1-associated protein [Corylus avellana]|uniref:fra a 1-associated protein n=1 Tax=Corylus avellana TaxID=13451 RepID=UPI00286C7CB2|nr:fra a 1-associated protein [Corylus avellana]
MGWVWRDDEEDEIDSSAGGVSSGKRCATRKVLKSQCRTEEVERGKFIRKCEKTEQVLRECVGKPVEVVEFNKEYTEDDVTDEVVKGSLSFGTLEQGALDFPGLRNDIEGITRSFFGNLNRFFEEADGMKNNFLNVFGVPRVFDGGESSSPSMRRGIPVEEGLPKAGGEGESGGQVDLSGLATDV